MKTRWEPIVESALRTPSPHNTQPWRLRIHDDSRATLYIEIARTLPDEDTTGHFQRCAMGMFLEALRILAANHGYTLSYSLVPNPGETTLVPIAELELKDGAEASSFSDELFETRMTSRLPSTGVCIEPGVTSQLIDSAAKFGQRYTQIDAPSVIEAIAQENIRAIFHDLNIKSYHNEIAGWFRYSDKEASLKRDGLDYRCMGVPPIQLKLMRDLPQVMRWPIIRNVVGRTYRQQLGKISHIGVISGAFFDDAASIRAGAFLMRFWLEIARHNIFIHPFGNLVTNPQAAAAIRDLTGISDIWLVFRIGHTNKPPQSYRRTQEEILIHD